MAVAIAVVVGTVCRHILALRRLCKLPHFSKTDATLAWAWWLQKAATGRRRTGVIDRPVHNASASRTLADVFSGDDILVVSRGYSRTVDPGAKSRGSHTVDPGVDICLLLGQHTAALLLIEKNYGRVRKAFAVGRGHGGLRVRLAHAPGVGDGFQCGIEASVEEDEKSQPGRFNGG